MPRRLLIFGKVPHPGRVKTRLSPALGAEGAARLYRAFLHDTVALCRDVPAETRELWLASPAGEERPDDPPFGIPVRRQEGDGLGKRLAHAFDTAFREGAGRVLVVGSDHPTLPPEHLERALELLCPASPLAVGPTADGGYYAIGLHRSAWPGAADLFRGIPWSTGRVLEVTLSRAEGLGLEAARLPEWYDVDEPDQLARLGRDAAPGSRTRKALEGLLDRLAADRPET